MQKKQNSDENIKIVHLKKNQLVKITKDMIIIDVIKAFPETLEVFDKLKIHCVRCIAATIESIEEGVSLHGMDPDKVCKILNQTIKKHHVRRSSTTAKSRKR